MGEVLGVVVESKAVIVVVVVVDVGDIVVVVLDVVVIIMDESSVLSRLGEEEAGARSNVPSTMDDASDLVIASTFQRVDETFSTRGGEKKSEVVKSVPPARDWRSVREKRRKLKLKR